MIDVRFLVKDVATLKKAKTQPELEGAIAMVLAKIELAQGAKELKPKAEAKGLGYGQIVAIFRDVEKGLGSTEGSMFSAPPYPTPDYCMKVYRAAKSWGMTSVDIYRIAEAAAKLKLPVALSWVMWNHEAILAGKFAGGRTGGGAWAPKPTARIEQGKNWHGGNTFLADKLPED